jgi:DNA primase
MMALRAVDAATLKERVSPRDVLDARGITYDRRGRAQCPLHGGDNREAFSIKGDRFRCFACGAAGDVFDLVQRLDGVGFKEARAVISRLAGVGGAGNDAQWRERAQQDAVTRRRKQALARWRSDRLNRSLTAIGNLERRQGHVRALLAATRNDAEGHEAAWDKLEVVSKARDEAEWLAVRLSPEDESVWARVWLEEQKAERQHTQEFLADDAPVEEAEVA